MPDTSVQLLAARLDAYFAELARCGAVPPAARYRLEGYLQALLETGQLQARELSGQVAARTAAFNAAGGVQLQQPDQAWQLPYRSPLAPVNKPADR